MARLPGRRFSYPPTSPAGTTEGAHRMLRPQDTATRERKTLNGLWNFALDPAGVGRSAGWFAAALPDARAMAVPASYNDILVGAQGRGHVGDAWYQTTVRVPRGWDEQRVVLRLDSATHAGEVW